MAEVMDGGASPVGSEVEPVQETLEGGTAPAGREEGAAPAGSEEGVVPAELEGEDATAGTEGGDAPAGPQGEPAPAGLDKRGAPAGLEKEDASICQMEELLKQDQRTNLFQQGLKEECSSKVKGRRWDNSCHWGSGGETRLLGVTTVVSSWDGQDWGKGIVVGTVFYG